MLTDGGEGRSRAAQAGGAPEFLVGPIWIGAAREPSTGDVSDDGGAVDALSGGDLSDRLAGDVGGENLLDLVCRETPLDLPNRVGIWRV